MYSSEPSKVLYSNRIPILQRRISEGEFSASSHMGVINNEGQKYPPLFSSYTNAFRATSPMPQSQKPFPINLEESANGVVLDTKKTELLLEIERKANMIEIRLMDPTDITFYYYSELDESTFNSLSKSQHLLISFSEFPSKLIEFLNQIVACSKELSPRFVAHLSIEKKTGNEEAPGTLSIVEINSFKQITYLSIPVIPAPRSRIQNHLLLQNRHYMNELAFLKAKFAEYEKNYNYKVKEVSEEKEYLKKEIENKDMEMRRLSERLNDQLKNENNKVLAELDEMKRRCEKEKKENDAQWKDKIRALNDKINALESHQSKESGFRTTLEDNLTELNEKYKTSQLEVTKLRQDLMTLSSSEKIKEEFELELNKAKERIKTLHTEILEKEEKTIALKLELKQTRDSYREIEDRWKVDKGQISNLENGINKATTEINKANEIINKLQTELRSNKNKTKNKSALLEEKEKESLEFRVQYDKLLAELEQMKKALDGKDKDIGNINREKNEKEKEILELRDNLVKNEKVIDWLQKQLSGTTGVDGPVFKYKPNINLTLPERGPIFKKFHVPSPNPLNTATVVHNEVSNYRQKNLSFDSPHVLTAMPSPPPPTAYPQRPL